MMAGSLLDHHRDPAAELLIDVLDRGRNPPQQGIDAATDVQHGHVGRSKVGELFEDVGIHPGIIGIDARDLRGIRGGPCIGVFATAAHPDKRRLLGQPVFLGQERVPGVPCLIRPQAGVGRDIRDVKPTLQQLDLGLRLVVPVTPSPRPRVAQRRPSAARSQRTAAYHAADP